MINRIILHRARTVPARISHLEAEALIHLFARLNAILEVLAVFDQTLAPLIKREIGIHEIPIIFQKPLHTVVIAAFFISRERDDQVTIRFIVFLPHTNESRDPSSGLGYVVRRSPAIEVTVSFCKRERIERPVLP